MTDEQRAAIERTEITPDDAAARLRAGGLCGDELLHCALVLANARLSEHPADDYLQVTEEWLRSVGFGEDETGCYLITEDDAGWLLAWNIDEDGHSGADQWTYRGDDMPESCVIQTRGDVRRLCSALGITLATAGK